MTYNTRLTRLALAALFATAACSDDGPTAANEPPAATTETLWDIDVIVRYVRASALSACDGDNIFGDVDAGEFQYRIVGTHGSTRKSTESTNYGSVLGADHELRNSELHNFTNQTWTFNGLRVGQPVKLEMWVTEWDGTNEDDYMNHRTGSRNVVPSALLPAGGSGADYGLAVGTSNCGLTLIYDINVRARVVNVE